MSGKQSKVHVKALQYAQEHPELTIWKHEKVARFVDDNLELSNEEMVKRLNKENSLRASYTRGNPRWDSGHLCHVYRAVRGCTIGEARERQGKGVARKQRTKPLKSTAPKTKKLRLRRGTKPNQITKEAKEAAAAMGGDVITARAACQELWDRYQVSEAGPTVLAAEWNAKKLVRGFYDGRGAPQWTAFIVGTMFKRCAGRTLTGRTASGRAKKAAAKPVPAAAKTNRGGSGAKTKQPAEKLMFRLPVNSKSARNIEVKNGTVYVKISGWGEYPTISAKGQACLQILLEQTKQEAAKKAAPPKPDTGKAAAPAQNPWLGDADDFDDEDFRV